MAKYKLTWLNDESTEIEAEVFNEEGSFVMFDNFQGERVYATPTKAVASIERLKSA